MKRLVCTVGAAAFVWIVSGQSASATPITYNWDAGTSFKLNDGATANLTGSFTLDFPTFGLTGNDIVITGGTHGEAGTYVPFANDQGIELQFLLGSTLLDLFVGPSLDLNPAPQDTKLVDATVSGASSTSISGGAQIASAAVPEPATLALFVPALLGLGLFWRRRQGTPRAA